MASDSKLHFRRLQVLHGHLDAISGRMIAGPARARQNLFNELMESTSRSLPIFVCNVAPPLQTHTYTMFEPRYLQLIEDLLEADSAEFGVCVKATSVQEEPASQREFADVGTLLRLQHCERMPNGRYTVVVEGISRFRVLSTTLQSSKNPVRSYDIAKVDVLNDTEESRQRAMYKPLREGFESFRRSCLEVTSESERTAPEAAVDFLGKAYGDWDSLKQALDGQRRGRDIGCELPWDGEAFMWKCVGCLPVKEGAKYRVLKSTSSSWRCEEVKRLLHVCSEALRRGTGGISGTD